VDILAFMGHHAALFKFNFPASLGEFARSAAACSHAIAAAATLDAVAIPDSGTRPNLK